MVEGLGPFPENNFFPQNDKFGCILSTVGTKISMIMSTIYIMIVS